MNNLRLQSCNDLLCRLFDYVDSTWSNSLSLFWLVAVLVCHHFGQDNLSPFWCRHFGVSPFWFVAILTIHRLWLQADERLYDAHPSGLLALTSQSRPSFKSTSIRRREIALHEIKQHCPVTLFAVHRSPSDQLLCTGIYKQSYSSTFG